eukprot:243913-Heterocapsa_arctica.AAC.1
MARRAAVGVGSWRSSVGSGARVGPPCERPGAESAPGAAGSVRATLSACAGVLRPGEGRAAWAAARGAALPSRSMAQAMMADWTCPAELAQPSLRALAYANMLGALVRSISFLRASSLTRAPMEVYIDTRHARRRRMASSPGPRGRPILAEWAAAPGRALLGRMRRRATVRRGRRGGTSPPAREAGLAGGMAPTFLHGRDLAPRGAPAPSPEERPDRA